MDSTQFYRLYLFDGRRPKAFLGNAFLIGPKGSLLTCRHVVDIGVQDRDWLAVFDSENKQFVLITRPPIFPSNSAIDLALLKNALLLKSEFFPILEPSRLLVGADVYTFGHFSIGGQISTVEQGYFGGKVVNFFGKEREEEARFTLPFPIIEGLSGSPILTYHNGPKVVGIAIGNRASRILAKETLEFKDEKVEYRETVNRIVEFGVAHHCTAIIQFLSGIDGVGHLITDQRVQGSE